MQTAAAICNFRFKLQTSVKDERKGRTEGRLPANSGLEHRSVPGVPRNRVARTFHEMQRSFGSFGPGIPLGLGADAPQGPALAGPQRHLVPSAAGTGAAPHRTNSLGRTNASARTGLKMPRFIPNQRFFYSQNH